MSAKSEEFVPCTDTGNAERLIQLYGKDIRYVPEHKDWAYWDGARWAFKEGLKVGELTKHVARSIRATGNTLADSERAEARYKWARSSESHAKREACLKLAKYESSVLQHITEFDQRAMLLNLKNCVVDLETGKAMDHQRGHYCAKQSAVHFDPIAEAPTWHTLLNDIFADDQELIAFIQRAVGYSLTADASEQCLFFLHGTGANGKSTLLNALRSLLGDYAAATPFASFLERKTDAVSNDLARLCGARLVLATEPDRNKSLSESLLKQITGGDPLSVRFLHKEFFEFEPCFKIWLAANHRPNIRETTEGIWRRIMLIPFEVQIPPEKRDKHLGQKLAAELPGILNWAIEGCLAWQREGLCPPSVVTNATSEYRAEMDQVGRFIEHRAELGTDYRIEISRFYEAYRKWTEEQGERHRRQSKVSEALKARGVTKFKSSVMFYRGIRLVEDDGDEAWHG